MRNRPNRGAQINQQLGLDFAAGQPRTIEERFGLFHREHPRVYAELVRLCREARRVGRHHIGIKMLWERMRWTFYVERRESDFKLNNNYHSRYARLIMDQEPDLAGIFETRELKAV